MMDAVAGIWRFAVLLKIETNDCFRKKFVSI